MTRTGGCQCGSLRYELSGDPVDLYVCHCLECRHQSASAFGISVIVRAADFTLVRGEASAWTRKATVSGSMTCYFCPTCGSRLWHGDPAVEETLSIKGGTFDDPPDLSRAKHIWVKRKMPGVVIPDGVETFDGEPPP